jgi:hypothetical protein
MVEPLRVHGLLDGRREHTAEHLLASVNLTPGLLDRFPHQLSGGSVSGSGWPGPSRWIRTSSTPSAAVTSSATRGGSPTTPP